MRAAWVFLVWRRASRLRSMSLLGSFDCNVVCVGVLVWWFVGVLVWWCIGMVVCWYGGLLVYWYGGLLVCWYDGVLVWWFGGVLVWWCIGMVVWLLEGLMLGRRVTKAFEKTLDYLEISFITTYMAKLTANNVPTNVKTGTFSISNTSSSLRPPNAPATMITIILPAMEVYLIKPDWLRGEGFFSLSFSLSDGVVLTLNFF
jgi:hypothetical protein